jgi:amidophosphoribosyltransferase
VKNVVFLEFFQIRILILEKSLFTGLTTIQNRGQDACGIAYCSGENIQPRRKEGLVSDLFANNIAELIRARFGIGHTLYATSRTKGKDGKASEIKPHPIIMGKDTESEIALVHNGNLPDLSSLKDFLKNLGYKKAVLDELNDSGLMAKTIHHFYKESKNLGDAMSKAAKNFKGSFALIVMSRNEMAILRDPHGIRPLSIAKDEQGRVIVSSETSTFDALKAQFIREIKPGELLRINRSNLNQDLNKINPRIVFPKTSDTLDAMESIYLSRPQSKLYGKYVSELRRDSGKELGKEFKKKHPGTKIDFVIPAPESGIPAATGFAEEMKLPINPVLVKNFHRRTFIDGGKDIEAKFSLIKDAIKDKSVAIVDDSIVKGNTSRKLVEFIRKAGPKKVHFLSASPPLAFPDHYGIDIPDQKTLIAHRLGSDEKKIANDIKADTVTYLSTNGFVKALGITNEQVELSKFTGVYPIDVGQKKAEQISGYKLAS